MPIETTIYLLTVTCTLSKFGSVSAFKKSLEYVNLKQFLTVYKFPLCVNVYTVFRLDFLLILKAYICVSRIRKITAFLARSDISDGNSLSVRYLSCGVRRLRCHYLVFSAYEFAVSEINRLTD